MFMGPCIVIIFQYISNKMQRYTVYFIWKLLYMFRILPPPIIKSAYNCTYSIWYLSDRYSYLPLSWRRWSSNCVKLHLVRYIHSFSSLSYDRSKASSKASSPHSAIQSFIFQMRVSSPFLKVIQ